AAKTDEVVFIDDKFKSPELLEKLHQPCLRASLVFPVKNGKKIFGVLNLATSSKRHKFNRENIASIARLVKMVDTVLS
ncbi:MAG: GAF domain-containing protein, partial [Candidatus Omnitrophica bacterium]|nr:GAF domain-containing protein [Candidatus Omnitrophota bacterium]